MQVGILFRNYFANLAEEKATNLVEERDTHLSNSMAATNPIDISSSESDSDFDLEDDGEIEISPITGSANSRMLPPWAVVHSTASRSTGQAEFLH